MPVEPVYAANPSCPCICDPTFWLWFGSERRRPVFTCSDPVFLLFPSPEEGTALLKDAEAKSKRVKKKR